MFYLNLRRIMPAALFLTMLLLLVGLPAVVLAADSISSPPIDETVDSEGSITITKTVTIDYKPEGAKVDVFFLTDSTGSMGGLIGAVKSSAGTILSNTASLGDVAFGVGEYRDIYDWFTYRLNQDITTNQAAAQAGINMWAAGGGGDWYEANLFALEQVAEDASWRSGSTRILVWFGDAPGHDPRAGSTEASATAALVGNRIIVEALNVSRWDLGIGRTGQAQRIAAATGGHFYPSVDTGAIIDAIADAIEAVFEEYDEVSLQAEGHLPEVDVTIDPPSYVGDYDRSIIRTFDFEVTLTCLESGEHFFDLEALVDGGIVATEDGRIDCSACEPGELWAVEYRYGEEGSEWDPFPTLFRSWLQVRMENQGVGDALSVTAEIMDWPDYVTILAGDVVLGDIPAGESAWSSTYNIEVDMLDPPDPSDQIYWRIEYDDTCGNHHIVEMVPEFPPEPPAAPSLARKIIPQRLWYPQFTHSMLYPNYPNPFNPETWIPYQVATDADVTVRIFDTRGQLIKTIALGQKEVGLYISRDKAAYWDGRNQFGETVSSGVYFYTLHAGDFTATRKMVIMK